MYNLTMNICYLLNLAKICLIVMYVECLTMIKIVILKIVMSILYETVPHITTTFKITKSANTTSHFTCTKLYNLKCIAETDGKNYKKKTFNSIKTKITDYLLAVQSTE